MYKIAYVSGTASTIAPILNQTIDDINAKGGKIEQIVQSQSSLGSGVTIVTITILYTSLSRW